MNTHPCLFIRFVLAEQFWILIVVVITQIYTCDKLHRIHMCTHKHTHVISCTEYPHALVHTCTHTHWYACGHVELVRS